MSMVNDELMKRRIKILFANENRVICNNLIFKYKYCYLFIKYYSHHIYFDQNILHVIQLGDTDLLKDLRGLGLLLGFLLTSALSAEWDLDLPRVTFLLEA